MPIYEYVCLDCEDDFETLVLSSEEEVCCPQCGSKRLERAMSAFSSLSVGSGGGCSTGSGFS
ncbi:MAG: zinc ribbon domain-containing protein [Proteobacteria bacterium]|nr:zinc ribbon domain-containing protein [Pseudomonadota bacterium]